MRCLAVSDIHSNLEAFEAVLQDAGGVDETWCLGDVVGYGADPNACVDLLRSRPHRCIAGNHDWATLGILDLRDFNQEARAANLWNRQQLSPETLAYLDGLPETLMIGPFTLAHGSPCNPIWEYILAASTAQAAFECFSTPYCLVGHSHTPIVFRLDRPDIPGEWPAMQVPVDGPVTLGTDRLIINPGSVGQPRDGDPRASYLILDTEALSIEHRRVAYDIEKTQAKMLALGLPTRQATRLAYGW